MANKSVFDDSLIGRMLDETFSGANELQNTRYNRVKNSLGQMLADNSISSYEITEYTDFWRINFRNGPIDFPINWGLVKAAKELLLVRDIAFVSVDSDFHCLCKVFQADMLGVYKNGSGHHFFIIQTPNLNLAEFLNDNAQKIQNQDSQPLVSQTNKKFAIAA